MSNTSNTDTIYVVLTGDNRGRLVRKGGHATQGFHYVSVVGDGDSDVVYGCEHKDNLVKVGVVSPEMWKREYICREGVRRTAEHFLNERCAHCGETLDSCTGESAR